jgi:hypothetical protein
METAVSAVDSTGDALSAVIIDPIEDVLDKVGLMQGEMAPLKRAVVGGAIGYGVISMWKPSWAYDPDDHHAYPWTVTHRSMERSQTTMMPYWLASLIPAVILGVLI